MAPSVPVRAPISFADSVQHFPTLCVEQVRLVSFDWENVRRFELTCDRIDENDAHVSLLRLTRETHPDPRERLQLESPE